LTVFVLDVFNLTADRITLLSESKMVLVNGTVIANTFDMDSATVLSGSGSVIATSNVTLGESCIVLPGRFNPLSCDECFHFTNLSLPQIGSSNSFGRLDFVTPVVFSLGVTFMFPRLTSIVEMGEDVVFSLFFCAEMSCSGLLALSQSQVTFSHLFVSNGTVISMVNETQGPFVGPAEPIVLRFGSLQLLRPFVLQQSLDADAMFPMTDGPCFFSFCQGTNEPAVVVDFGVSRECFSLTSSSLSVLLGIAPTNPCSSFTNTPPLSNQTAAPRGVEAWVIGVAIGVPGAVFLGVGIALVAVWFHKRSTSSYTLRMNAELKEKSLVDLSQSTK
jgi:hypothetical protein